MGKFKQAQLLLFISAVLLTILCSCPAQSKSRSGNSVVDHTEDEKILRSQVANYEKAFAAGDAQTIANMWMPEGTYTDVEGQLLKGREAINKFFSDNFKACELQPLKITVESIKFPADNVAIEEGHSRLLNGPNMDILSRYAVVHQKTSDKWLMSNVVETVYPETGSLQDWQWLIGNWTAKPTPEKTMHILASWATGHKFIRCVFAKESAEGELFAMVLIGKDPRTGQIISWHFDPSGGFGSGKWIKDGDTWIERANSTEASGVIGNAIYVMHKLNDNTFTWRSTQRYRGDENLPDTPEITITRD